MLPLSSHLYSYVTVFTIFAQAGGLIAAYIIEITLHYEKILETHCKVSEHGDYGVLFESFNLVLTRIPSYYMHVSCPCKEPFVNEVISR